MKYQDGNGAWQDGGTYNVSSHSTSARLTATGIDDGMEAARKLKPLPAMKFGKNQQKAEAKG